jgi:hypothetical protein|uniref:Class A beta-lactamase-related serine hydrolase n=1 Tax=Thermodesulfobium narugense TaxID=184064 RepID=A0A7C5KB11_9BACT
MKKIILAILFLMVFQDVALSKDFNDVSKELSNAVENIVRFDNYKRASLYVIFGDKHLSINFGKLSNDDVEKYDIGGLSRLFIGVQAARLSELGMLNLNDPISKYLPEIKNKYTDNIKVSDLLEDHTYLPFSYPYKIKSVNGLLDFLINNEGLLKYNQSYNRSQIAKDLSLLILERCEGNSSKNPFYDLFKDFNLNNTSFVDNQEDNNLALSNKIYSSSENIGRFLSKIFSNKKVSEEIFKRFEKTPYDQDLYFSPPFISQNITLINEDNVYEKYGLFYQYDDSSDSFLYVIPQKRFAIVFLSNFQLNFDKREYLSRELLRLSLKKLLNMDIFDYSSNKPLMGIEDKDNFLDSYEGFFENRNDIIEFHVVDKSLMCDMNKKFYFVKFFDDLSFSLVPVNNQEEDYVRKLRFRFTSINGVRYLDLLNFGQNIPFAMGIEETRYSDVWKERLGKWFSVNENSLIKEIEIEKFRGFYLLQYTDLGGERIKLLLVPVSNNNARILNYGDLAIRFYSNNNIRKFIFLGDEFVKKD